MGVAYFMKERGGQRRHPTKLPVLDKGRRQSERSSKMDKGGGPAADTWGYINSRKGIFCKQNSHFLKPNIRRLFMCLGYFLFTLFKFIILF